LLIGLVRIGIVVRIKVVDAYAARNVPTAELSIHRLLSYTGPSRRGDCVIETLVLVPVRNNAGRPRSFWRTLQGRFIDDFRAYSRLSDVRGAWVDDPDPTVASPAPSKLYRDVSRQYVVSLQSWSQFSAWFDILYWVLQQTGQEALYIKVAGIPDVVRALPNTAPDATPHSG
jgi:hypothetical protein